MSIGLSQKRREQKGFFSKRARQLFLKKGSSIFLPEWLLVTCLMVAEEKRTDFEVGASLGEVCKYKSPLPSVSLARRGCQGVNRAGKYDI